MLTTICKCIFLPKACTPPNSPSKNKDDSIENKDDSIQGITIGPTFTYDQYFELAKCAATPKPVDSSPFQLGSLDVIEHVKLDRNGISGLKPNDFLTVAKLALSSCNPLVPNTLLKRIKNSNYKEDEKKDFKDFFDQLEHEDSNEEAQPNCFQYTLIDLDDSPPEPMSDKDSSNRSSLPPIPRDGPRLEDLNSEDLGEIEEI